jgi:hypothetical protein
MNTWTFVILAISTFFNISLASTVTCFYPPKQWQVCVDVNDFEPELYMGEKTILSGNRGDIQITILTEKAIDGIAASERELYGNRYVEGFGVKESVEKFDCGPISCIGYRWKSSVEESPLKNRWSCHGYAVKEDISFDIHISADLSKHNKAEIVKIINSFKVEPTDEIKDFARLFQDVYAPYDEAKDKGPQEKERLKKVKTFLGQYPDNPEAYLILAEHYLLNDNHQVAKDYYLTVLKCRRSKLFLSPSSLWKCYDGLGLSYAMTNEVEKAKPYFEAGYSLAKEAEQTSNLAASSYNLACYYGETGDAQKCLRYLAEAIAISKDYQQQAADDSSFDKIKNDTRFIKLVGSK